MSQGSGLLESLSKLLSMIFDPRGIGLVLLVSLVLYPKVRKLKAMNHLLIFGAACYITWFFVFQDFRHYLPVCLLLFPVCYFSLRHVHIRWPKHVWAIWGTCAVVAFIPMYKYFSSVLLLPPAQTQKEFLASHLDYYPIATALNSRVVHGDILLAGESRIAYYNKRVITGSRFDPIPVLQDLRSATSPEELHQRLRRQGIRYIVYNEKRFPELYGPQAIFRLSDTQMSYWQSMLQQYSELRLQNGSIRLHELSDAQIW
jgi:hypothetical protein